MGSEATPEPGRAESDDSRGETRSAGVVLGSRAFVHWHGAGLELDARYRFASGIQLGAVVTGDYLDPGYLSGQPEPDTVATTGALVFVAPLAEAGPLTMFIRVQSGATHLNVLDSELSALRQVNQLGAYGHLRLGERSLFRLGVELGVDFEVDPTFELADQAQVVTAGYGYALSGNVLLYADVSAGGTYGFNGDNAKAILEGSLGVRLPLGKGGARDAF